MSASQAESEHVARPGTDRAHGGTWLRAIKIAMQTIDYHFGLL